MAKIDLIRRAQIGLGRRAKSRAQIMRAARALYSTRAIDAVTVDDVTLEASVAKVSYMRDRGGTGAVVRRLCRASTGRDRRSHRKDRGRLHGLHRSGVARPGMGRPDRARSVGVPPGRRRGA